MAAKLDIGDRIIVILWVVSMVGCSDRVEKVDSNAPKAQLERHEELGNKETEEIGEVYIERLVFNDKQPTGGCPVEIKSGLSSWQIEKGMRIAVLEKTVKECRVEDTESKKWKRICDIYDVMASREDGVIENVVVDMLKLPHACIRLDGKKLDGWSLKEIINEIGDCKLDEPMFGAVCWICRKGAVKICRNKYQLKISNYISDTITKM